MTKEIGFELVYPENCKELSEDLKPDEFRKRINDINNALQIFLSRNCAEDESIDEQSQEMDCRPNTDSNERLKYAGICIHLLSPQFTHYPDIDIRLRIGVALCRMLTIFCPLNPFEHASNCQSVVGDLLRFLNECILNITKLHSKQDVNYPRLHTILYTCCKLDVFTWCRLLDDGDKVLLETLKTIFTLMRNLKIWTWSDEVAVQNFILETLVTLMHQTTHLLSDEIVLFLLKFLIEPAKSTQPQQHLLAKDLILRMVPQIEYPIQLLLQNSLVKSDQSTTNTNESDDGVLDSDRGPLGEHAYILIYALHTLQESLVAPILPCVGLKLKSLIPRERKRAFRLLTRIFSEPNSTLHQTDPELWTSFLSRFNDIDVNIRSFCIQMVPLLLKNPEIPKPQIFDCLRVSAMDRSDAVRLLALKTVASLMREAKDDSIGDFFELVQNRSRDKSLNIRKEALAELASFYKRCLLSGNLDLERMTVALNATLHMYYQPSAEDKIAVERLFKSCIIPYNQETRERVQSLFLCYQLADSASIKSIQELLKMQFLASTLIRDALAIILDNHGKRIVGESSKAMMERIQKISLLLPKSEKSIDSLKRFFNAVHTDGVLRTSLGQLLHPRCPSRQSAQCLRDILKRISQPPPSAPGSNAHSTAPADAAYEHTVKLLLERCASVLFDEAFGQELLTQLVVSRETLNTSTESGVSPAAPATSSLANIELTRGLRILLALSVYHKETLPADDVLMYLQSVLASVSPNTIPEVPADTKTDEEDPPTPTELSLQIICCMLGGGPIYAPRDAGGSGTAIEQHVDPASLRASLTAESHKKATHSAAKKTSKAHAPGSYSGSADQLYEQTLVILPWLQSFCTTGMTADCPPLLPETAPPVPESKSPAAATTGTKNFRKRGADPAPSGSRKKKASAKSKEAAEPKEEEVTATAAVAPAPITEAQAGLAWRRERRRAKLAVRVLRQLLSVVHSLAGPHSPFPKGPVSSLLSEADDDATSSTATTIPADGDGCSSKESANADASSPNDKGAVEAEGEEEEAKNNGALADLEDALKMGQLEKMVQDCLDSIVKTCLACDMTSPHYVTSLTSLSHIGLLFPGVYNRQLKTLMTSQLISQLLTKDTLAKPTRRSRASITPPDSSKPSDWTKDGNLSVLTRAKIAAVKLMTNWLVGLQIQNKQVAQVIIRLLHRIIVHEGDLTCGGNMSYGEMSRMRLVAATSWLKVAHFQFYVEVIEVAWYQSMSYVLCDPCPAVRSHFLSVLHQGLLRLQLPLEYIAMFVHAADVQDNAFRHRAKQYLVANVKRRREFLSKHTSFTNNPKLLFAILPDFVLAYAIHLLAHDPDWSSIDDTARLLSIKSAVWYVLEPIMSGANNYSFLRRLLELIKHSRDALCPEDDLACAKMYVVCDIALGLLLTRCTNMVWKSSQFEIKLPRTLFVNAPPDFINPDFAQLYKPAPDGALEESEPRVTFTPAKNARAVKEGLIPPIFLRHKAGTAPHTTPGENGDDSKEEAAATQQEGLSDAATAAFSKKERPKRTEKTTRQTKKGVVKPTMTPKEVSNVPSSPAPQVDLDEEEEQPKSQLADHKGLEIPATPAANQLSASETPSSDTTPVTTAARKRVHSRSTPKVNGSLSTNDFEGLETADVTVAVNSKKRRVTLPSDPSQAVAAKSPSPKQANGVRTLKNASNLRQGKLNFQGAAGTMTTTAAAKASGSKASPKQPKSSTASRAKKAGRMTAAKSPKTSRRAPTRKAR